MKPQLTTRVRGQDGKFYVVSTMRYQKREFDEIWETAVFEGTGCLTFGRQQRFSDWAFDPQIAQTRYASTVQEVAGQPTAMWLMSPERIKVSRDSAIKAFMQPPQFFVDEPDPDDE